MPNLVFEAATEPTTECGASPRTPLNAGLDTGLERIMKLTKAQERAKAKLTDKWLAPYDLQESITTLNVLVRRGVAVMKRDMLGSMFCPRTALNYKLNVSNVKLTNSL